MIRTLAALFLFAGAAAFAADPPAAIDTKSLDKSIVTSLRDVHDRGADLYNMTKDYPAAYRLYEGSLLTVKPLLAHRPDVQKTIENSLAAAGKETDPAQKAFLLHEAIEKVRADLKLPPAVPKVKDPVPMPMPKPEPKPEPMPKTKVEPKPVLKTYSVPEGTADATAKILQLKYPLASITAVPASNQIVVSGTAEDQAAIAKWFDDKKPPAPNIKPKEPAPMPRPKEPEKPKVETGSIIGKVTVKEAPLAEGMVTFVSLDKKAPFEASTKVNEDGEYKVKDLPVGEYAVAVSSKKEGAVPARFTKAETSGLTYRVVKGEATFDIVLK